MTFETYTVPVYKFTTEQRDSTTVNNGKYNIHTAQQKTAEEFADDITDTYNMIHHIGGKVVSHEVFALPLTSPAKEGDDSTSYLPDHSVSHAVIVADVPPLGSMARDLGDLAEAVSHQE